MATRSVVTFLFTDIEGSTRLWEDDPVAMDLALARHDALLRYAIEGNGGVVFKTVVDAFCAAFGAASDCVRAAADARLLEGPLLIVCALEAVATVGRAGGDRAAALAALEEARSVALAGAVPGAYLSSVTRTLGELAAEAGHTDEAKTLLTEAAGVARAVGDSWGEARAMATPGHT